MSPGRGAPLAVGGRGAPAAALPLVAEDFLVALVAEKGRSANTIAAYRRDLARYAAWLGDSGSDPLDVDAATFRDFVGAEQASGRAASTVKRGIVAVRSFHRFMAEEGIRTDDPTSGVAVPHVPLGLPKALTEEEVSNLLAAVPGTDRPVDRRDTALLELLYGTGARISEAVGLSVGDLDLESGLVRLYGKGSKERVVPLGRMVRFALASWLAEGGRERMLPDPLRSRSLRRDDAEALLLNQRGGRLTRQGAWGIVHKHALAAGITRDLSPHILRHSCATHMLDHGADVRAVQELLGHASITTTQVYTMVSTERLRQVYDDAHPRARLR